MEMLFQPKPAEITLAGVAASTAESAQKAMEKGGFLWCTDNYIELIGRDDVQAINICTPNHLHYDIAMAAIKAGKHVYCDKPLGMNSRETKELAEAAERAGIVNMVTFQNRFIPAILRAKGLIAEGRLGEIFQFRTAYLHGGYSDPNKPMSWRLNVEQSGGGALYDLGSHIIDLILYLLGDISEVQANLHTFIKERPVSPGASTKASVLVDDAATINVRMTSGAIGTIEVSRFATGANDDLRLEIHGSKGAIAFSLMDPNYLQFYDNTADSGPYGGTRGFTKIETVQRYEAPAVLPGPKCPVGWTRFHTQGIYHFVDNIVNGRRTKPDFRDGHVVQRVLTAAEQSGLSGTWCRIALD